MDKANIDNLKVNRGCLPLTSNRISAGCMVITHTTYFTGGLPYWRFQRYAVTRFRFCVAKIQITPLMCYEQLIWKRDIYPTTTIKLMRLYQRVKPHRLTNWLACNRNRMISNLCWGVSVRCLVLVYGWLMSNNMTVKIITMMVMRTVTMTVITMLWKIMIMLPSELCFTYLQLYIHTYMHTGGDWQTNLSFELILPFS